MIEIDHVLDRVIQNAEMRNHPQIKKRNGFIQSCLLTILCVCFGIFIVERAALTVSYFMNDTETHKEVVYQIASNNFKFLKVFTD